MAQFRRRMNQETRLAILEDGKKNIKKSDRKKRYREKNRLLREERKQEREEFKKEKSRVIKDHTVSGVAPQAERPPQLNQIIDKMMKNNAMFEKEAKSKPKIDHKKAMAICRRNMNRFDWVVCFECVVFSSLVDSSRAYHLLSIHPLSSQCITFPLNTSNKHTITTLAFHYSELASPWASRQSGCFRPESSCSASPHPQAPPSQGAAGTVYRSSPPRSSTPRP